MIEHFKPAGHKAPTLTTAIALEETYKPIQRVVRNNETIRYVFRDAEYGNGHVEDLVLANDVFKNKTQRVMSLPEWRRYLANKGNNPCGFSIPSGPLMMELTYRAMQDKSKLHEEVIESIGTTYKLWPAFNTTINYNTRTVHHSHLDEKQKPQQVITPEKDDTILTNDMDITTQMFLSELLGRRAPQVNTILSKYGAPVVLWTLPKEYDPDERALVLGIHSSGWFDIKAHYNINDVGPARGVAPAERILNMKGVKVCDD